MAYVKKVWTDRTVERPLTYILQDNGDGTHTLIPSEGSIISTGTPITAGNMNNIENGIETLEVEKAPKANPTFTGTITSEGKVIANAGGQALDIKAGPTEDHAYVGFYKDSQDLLTRSGWLGYGSALTTDFSITNTLGNVVLLPASNNVLIGTYGCYIETPSNGSIYLHKDALNYLRVTSGQQDMYFGSSQTLTFTNGKIKNGFGGIVIESNSSATAPAIISAPMDYIYVQGRDGCRVTAPGTTATWKPIFASAFTVNSTEESKTNIKPVAGGALATVMETQVYDYHLVDELEENHIIEGERQKVATKNAENVKKRKGFLAHEAPQEIVYPILNNETGEADSYGIDLTGLNATLWKAVQELNLKVDELQNELRQSKK